MTRSSQPVERDNTVPRHARSWRSHRVLKYVGLLVTAVVVAVPVGAYAVAHHVQGEITTVDTSKIVPTTIAKAPSPKDPDPDNDLNILVLGTDSRAGTNNRYAHDANGGERSDVAIIVHVSADRKRIDMVSIPRDTMVQIPSCTVDDKGTTTAAGLNSFNAAFSNGADAELAKGGSVTAQDSAGALCAWQTVEKLTDVSLDGFVVMDFSGVANMVNAIHGVTMCVPGHVDSPEASNLVLQPGWQTLDGFQALEYARARHGVQYTDASDLDRILNQQAMLSSMADKVFSQDVLTSPTELLSFVEATAKSLTMSKKLGSLSYLTGLGYSLRHMNSSDITFITAPYEAYPANDAKVEFSPAAATIFADLRHDTPIAPKAASTKSSSKSTGKSSGKSKAKSSSTASSKASLDKMPSASQRSLTGLNASDVPTNKAQCDAEIKSLKEEYPNAPY